MPVYVRMTVRNVFAHTRCIFVFLSLRSACLSLLACLLCLCPFAVLAVCLLCLLACLPLSVLSLFLPMRWRVCVYVPRIYHACFYLCARVHCLAPVPAHNRYFGGFDTCF